MTTIIREFFSKNENQKKKKINKILNDKNLKITNGESKKSNGNVLNGHQEASGTKTRFWAYFWWLFGGIFGAHHYYLERYDEALVYFMTFGGLGVGWLRDSLRLSTYILDTNQHPHYVNWCKSQIKIFKKPPFSCSRWMGSIFFSSALGQLLWCAVPQEEIWGINFRPLIIFTPLVIAWATWLVGNIGRECGPFAPTLITSYLLYPTLYYVGDSTMWVLIMSIGASMIFDTFSKTWRLKKREKPSLKKRLAVFLIVAVLYGGAWTSFFYFNATITDNDGEEIKITEAIKHLFKAPLWQELGASLVETYRQMWHQGLWASWQQLMDLSDLNGEMNAYKVLGLSQMCSQSELTAKWRALSKEHHPDKVKGSPEERRKAEIYFMEIQEAYEILSKVKYRRQKKNRKAAD